MRVLGVDPGLTRCGLGAVEGRPGAPLSLVAVGVVRTPADDDIGSRLVAIERGIEQWLDDVRPDSVAVERVFAQHNVRTVMGTAQAAAVAIVCAARRGLPVALHTPSEVKAAITGSGTAGKQQVGTMVTRLLRLDAMPRPADAADALALAICHVWRGGAQNRLADALARAREDSVIASLSGRTAAIGPGTAVVEVGGVGVLVHCTPATLGSLRVGEPARLATSLVVREESLTLYGFADADERDLFEAVQRVAGVGPKLALAMLAVHAPNALRVAVAAGDVKALTMVPGIGPKVAQRIILELKDKLGAPEPVPAAVANGRAAAPAWREQVHTGLVGLGYTARDADEAVAEVAPLADAALAEGRRPDIAALLKAALRTLSR
ncbi:Holliday junction branch migration protein RuvA [Thermocatellispora tengchongensis]|uniref:Holliday junction branch migration protein RuvA n=1 Tax=Thermocatellispora tengchongensis TaxID=1073253 RepID=UPI0036277DD6